MQSLFLPVATRNAIVVALVLGAATSCQRARAPGPPLVVPVPERGAPGIGVTGQDTSCETRSGIAFRLQMLTLRALGASRVYGRESVRASFGDGDQRQEIPGMVLWMASQGKMGQLPNSGIYPTDSSGSLPVRIVVVDTSSLKPFENPIGWTYFELPLKPHWVWWITSTISPRRDIKLDEIMAGPPARSAAVALEGGDSLYVTAYGSSRRCGIILN